MGGIRGMMPETWEDGVVVRSDEPMLGFRAWRGAYIDGVPFLIPIYSIYPPWPHYERMVASCPHWLKHNTDENHQPGQRSQQQRDKSVAGSYLNHPRYLNHPPDEAPPYPGCACGLYFNDRMEQITNAPGALWEHPLLDAPQASVVGSARLWGRMVRHERGWRVQYAYPERLFVLKPVGSYDIDVDEYLSDWKQALERAYGVPVGFCNRKDFENLGKAIED